MFTTRSRAVALATLTSLALLAGCGSSSNDNKPDAPTKFTLTPGDGRIYVTWDDQSATTDLRYWLFSAQTTTMKRDDYRKYPDARITAPVTTGFALTGLTNGLDYAMFLNATHGNGPGGAETETKTAKPRLAGDNWATPVDLDGPTNSDPINGITTFNGYYIAVGAEGGVYYAIDPRTKWTRATTPATITATLRSVVANTSVAVAVGENGVLLYSTSITTWSAGAVKMQDGATTTSARINSVAVAPDAFIAVGDNGLILRSTDGVNWTELTTAQKPGYLTATDALPAPNLYAARNLNGTLLIVGEKGTMLKATTTSDLSGATVDVTGVLTKSTNLRALLYYGGLYIAAGDAGELIISNDLANSKWYEQDNLGTTNTINGLALGSRALAAGDGGTVRVGVVNSDASNTAKLIVWTAPTQTESTNVPPSGNLLAVVGSAAGFVATTDKGTSLAAF